MAYGSSAELETQLTIINQEYKHVVTNNAQMLLSEVQRMLFSLMERLKS